LVPNLIKICSVVSEMKRFQREETQMIWVQWKLHRQLIWRRCIA